MDINKFWAIMMGMYGSKFSGQYGATDSNGAPIVDPSGAWRVTLNDLTGEQINQGLIKLRDAGEWPPTAPGFRDLCVEKKDGVPDKDICFVELQKYLASPEHRRKVTDLSPFTYHTYVKNLDSYNYRQMPPEEARRAFNAAYKATLFQIETGETICEPKNMIESKTVRPIKNKKTEKVAEKTIGSLRAMF